MADTGTKEAESRTSDMEDNDMEDNYDATHHSRPLFGRGS